MKINCLVILYYNAMVSLRKLNKFFKSLWLSDVLPMSVFIIIISSPHRFMLEAVDIWNLHKILVPTVYDMYLKKFLPGWVIFEANSLGLPAELGTSGCTNQLIDFLISSKRSLYRKGIFGFCNWQFVKNGFSDIAGVQ